MSPTNMNPQPASAESGYTLTLQPLENPFVADDAFRRVLAWYLPSEVYQKVEQELKVFAGEAISEQIRTWGANAEKQQPYVKQHNAWGARYDVDLLVTSEGWKQLKKWGAKNGVVAEGYEPTYGSYRRIVQQAKGYFFGPSSGLTSCPLSMTDGAARLLSQFLPSLPPNHPFHDAYNRLVARTDGWTSGQWMTERAGGSDVHNSETWATYAPLAKKQGEFGAIYEGDYLISGFKFFSSATDADITVLLAKTENGKISAFLAPLKKTIIDPSTGQEKVVSNGIRIHRLKNKMGTKQLPTAELELKDVRAHLVGPLDRGIPTIAHILNITRSWACTGSVAGWRRSTSIAKSFAKSRTTMDQPLWSIPLHLRTLADNELKLRGMLQFSFFNISLMGFSESSFPTDLPAQSAPLPTAGNEAQVVLRTLTATGKAVINKNVVVGMQECMECMGGVGYLDDPDEPENNVARGFRDTSVNTIWEGTTNVLSSETIRHLAKGDNLAVFSGWIERAIGGVKNEVYRNALGRTWSALQRRFEVAKVRLPEALGNGRRIMFTLGWVVCGVLLAHDAQRDGDSLANEVARRWIVNVEAGVGEWTLQDVVRPDPAARYQEGEERAAWDCRLVWGVELPKDAALSGRRVPAKI
ncbi:hypothetical protein FQN57_005626 [Myotisia sp. PD_48]|nr:hypothetical protein FQN57_005626 [Myotisia sp. PD_48]